MLAQLAMLTIVQPSFAGVPVFLRWGGGRVIAEPKVYAVYWGREWQGIGPNPGPDRFSDFIYTESSVRNYINFFLKNVGGSFYQNTLTQYCKRPSSFAKTYCHPGDGPIKNRRGLLTDEQGRDRIWIDATSPAPWRNMPWGRGTATDEARRAVNYFRSTGQFQDSDADNAIFMIFTPPGKSPASFGGLLDSCARYGEDRASPRKAIVLIPYNPESRWCDRGRVNPTSDTFGHGWLDGYSIWMSRMLAGAITNPDQRGGWATRFLGQSLLDVAESCALPTVPPLPPENRYFGRVPNAERMAVAPLRSNQEPAFLLPSGECVFESRATGALAGPFKGLFGNVPLRQDSQTIRFRIGNITSFELHMEGPDSGHPNDRAAKSVGEHASDFVVDSTDCDNKALAVEQDCAVAVTFRPQGEGERRAKLRFFSDAGEWVIPDPRSESGERRVRELEIPLSGTGEPPRTGPPGPVYTFGGPVIRDPKLFAVFWGPAWNEQSDFPAVSPSGTTYHSRQIMAYIRRFLEHLGGSDYLRVLTQYCSGYIGQRYSYCSAVPAAQRTMITNPRSTHSTSAGLCNASARCWVDTAPNTREEPDREPAPGMALSRVGEEVLRAKSHFETEDRDAIFLIFTPPGKAPAGFGNPPGEGQDCSRHLSTELRAPYYAYIPFVLEYPLCRRSQGPDDDFGHGFLDTYSFWTAFATANTITNPTWDSPIDELKGWRDPRETAAMCPTTSANPLPRQRFGLYEFTVPYLWSNRTSQAGGACVFEQRAGADLQPPDGLNFGDVPVTTSQTKAVTLKNEGPVELKVKNVRLIGPSDFSVVNNGCLGAGGEDKVLAALPPRNTCTVRVRFRPTGRLRKTKQAVLVFDADVDDDVYRAQILSGTPVSPIKVSRAGATLGKQAIGGISASQRIEIENTGDESVELRRPVLSGGDAGDFRVTRNGCEDVTLDPERPQCAIEVAFVPQEREGEEEGEERWRGSELEIRSSADEEPDAVRLWGEVADPPVTLDPRSWNFGEQRLRTPSYTKWFQVKNNSDRDLTVTGASITPGNPSEFSTYNMCAIEGPVASGRSCGVGVTFSPTTLGPREATLRVAYQQGPDSGFVTAGVRGSGIGETLVPADPLVPELIGPLPSDPLYWEFSPWG